MKTLVFSLFLFVIMVASNVNATSGVAVDTIISIELDKEGNAHITEDYKITFLWDSKREEFDLLKADGITELVLWNNFSDIINKHVIGSQKDFSLYTKKSLGLDHVVIEYSNEEFAKYLHDEGRAIVLEMGMTQFSFYNETWNDINNRFTLPEKTTLTFIVEDTRQNKNTPLSDMVEAIPAGFFMGPYLQDSRIVVLANGPITLSEFSVHYKVEKGISESWGLDSLYSFFVKNQTYGIILIILIVLTAVFRKSIVNVLSEGFSSEEDIEMPKREL